MANRVDAASLAVLAAVALMLGASAAAARPVARAGAFPPAHASVRPPLRHHVGVNGGYYWPGSYYEPADAAVDVASTSPAGDVHYSYSNEVPWDWAHRWPPQVAPSDHPYVPSCTTDAVTVMGRGGRQQTVDVTRCY